MQNSSTRTIVEAGLMVAVFSILAIVSRYIPFLGLLTFIIPVPFLVIYVRHNISVLIMTLFVSIIIGSIISQDLIWLFLIFIVAPMTVATGFLIKKNKPTALVLLIGSLVTTIGVMAMMRISFQFFAVPGMPADMGSYFEKVFNQSSEIMRNFNIPNLELALEKQAQYVVIAKMTMPALLMMASFLITSINVLLSYKLFNVLKVPYRKPGQFRDFSLPNNIMLGITILFLLVFGLGALKVLNSDVVLMNVVTLFMFIFTIQGIATAYGWLLSRGYHKGLLIGLISFLLLFNMMIGFSLLGWLDLIFDFRKLKKRSSES